MATSNIPSSKITAFPAGRRNSSDNKNGSLVTEARLASLANSLLDVNGFVITKSGSDLSDIKVLEFNILGRYFKIDNGDYGIISQGTGVITPGDNDFHIYAGIAIDESAGLEPLFYEIIGQDDESDYEGLRIFTSGGDLGTSNNDNTRGYEVNGVTYTLVELAVKDANSNWIIPEPTLPKILFIDGGTID